MSEPRGLGLTMSHRWQVLWILKSLKVLGKAMYTVHSNTIYPWFLRQNQSCGYLTPSPFRGTRIYRMRLVRSAFYHWAPKLSPVGRGYSWMGDHLGKALCWFSKKLWTYVSRVVVVGLSRASRVFLRVLRVSSLCKINTLI